MSRVDSTSQISSVRNLGKIILGLLFEDDEVVAEDNGRLLAPIFRAKVSRLEQRCKILKISGRLK